MNRDEQIWSAFELLEKEDETVDFSDLVFISARNFGIERETCKAWAAKQQMLGKIKSAYVGADYFLLRV